jgi:hypothetical protein
LLSKQCNELKAAVKRGASSAGLTHPQVYTLSIEYVTYFESKEMSKKACQLVRQTVAKTMYAVVHHHHGVSST